MEKQPLKITGDSIGAELYNKIREFDTNTDNMYVVIPGMFEDGYDGFEVQFIKNYYGEIRRCMSERFSISESRNDVKISEFVEKCKNL